MPNHGSRKFPLLELIRSLMPITFMGRAMLAGIAVWFINWAFAEDQTLFGSETLKKIIDIASILAFVPLIYFVIKGARWVTQHLLWRLRRRLIVNYLLIGALPLLLVALLIGLIGIAVVIQSTTDLVGRRLDGYIEQSRASAVALTGDLSNWNVSRLNQDQLRQRLQERANALEPIFPELTLSVRGIERDDLAVSVTGLSSENVTTQRQSTDVNHRLPEWLRNQNEFHGLVVDENEAGERQVRVRHIIKLAGPAPIIFQLTYPAGETLCRHLKKTIDLEVKPGQVLGPLVLTPFGAQFDQDEIAEIGGREGPAGWPIYKTVNKWSTGKQMQGDVLLVDSSFLWPGQIWRRVRQFQSGSTLGYAIVGSIAGLAVLFFMIALLAIISAVFLTRSITGAVYYLYEGTKRVEAGDFDHEIPITGNDQLGKLSLSFNQMTRSIRELLSVSAQKQRLDQEMTFAAKVQSQLFPRSVPKSEKLDFAPGICIPARSVSGDYYDFLEVTPGIIGIVVADVCGKGVSAALMMANLQANLRGQVQAYHDTYSLKVNIVATQESSERVIGGSQSSHPVRRIVERVNQQIVDSVMDASYITFFYAEFNEQSSTLRYTNAGHNPPLLLRRNGEGEPKIERLESGGTVLGLFREIEFEDADLKLESGDMVVVFTDGLIEAHNPRNEEFGEERVIELLIKNRHLPAGKIEREILEAVRRWTQDAEQEDDLTLVIFKLK
jgi:phosphoserine phosphatase RsbU/P